MKKWISIVLLSLYLFSTTELYQLLKIPVLIEHFIEHKEQNPEITLRAFIKMHYDHPVKDADYQTDQKLPFVVHSSPLVLIFTVPDCRIEVIKTIIKEDHKEMYSYNYLFYNKGALNSIWQPPKHC